VNPAMVGRSSSPDKPSGPAGGVRQRPPASRSAGAVRPEIGVEAKLPAKIPVAAKSRLPRGQMVVVQQAASRGRADRAWDDGTGGMDRPLRVAVLGSTGSIGSNTLDVVAASGGRLTAHVLAARRDVETILHQARLFRPAWVVLADPAAAAGVGPADLPDGTRLAVGEAAIGELAASDDIDRVVSAIVGAAGLRGTWAAVEAGKVVALANKESLVMAGPLVTDLAARTGARILPVDSEHSAIQQALASGRDGEVARIVLTASGGPFRMTPASALPSVTPAEALRHPTWSMGRKITIDSATMMNKALEIIEARWLFGLPAERIAVVVHPQSVVHSMVEFVDGSVIAQLSPPDMRLPIQYALEYPRRRPGPARRLDWSETLRLDFEPPDPVRFPALALGRAAAARGGTAGAALNAANEVAVEAFLAGRIRFTGIAEVCGRILQDHPFEAAPSLDTILKTDAWARHEAAKETTA
jgi:1-deoxy-D-xylulose-5-phosphate reductoisomerase